MNALVGSLRNQEAASEQDQRLNQQVGSIGNKQGIPNKTILLTENKKS